MNDNVNKYSSFISNQEKIKNSHLPKNIKEKMASAEENDAVIDLKNYYYSLSDSMYDLERMLNVLKNEPPIEWLNDSKINTKKEIENYEKLLKMMEKTIKNSDLGKYL